ncbi:Conserved_hypothetical protein [Hexamita inflata]|uniref:Uncharacterized protein n=1 Tax=Hexamita inflata TaxID=28002 RepID=A0AA86TUD7_9EUKA|nr:Conserved hypothetical protein [Hexamita inflata]
MQTAQIQEMLNKNPAGADAVEILQTHGDELIQLILRKPNSTPELEKLTAALHLVAHISDDQACCEIISNNNDCDKLLDNCLSSAVRMKTSKLFSHYIQILTNMCVSHCARVYKQISPAELVPTFEIIQTNNEAALQLLETISAQVTPTTQLLKAVIVHLQKRVHFSVHVSRILKVLFTNITNQNINVFSSVIKDVVIECTGTEFKPQFVSSLKNAETKQKDVFSIKKMQEDAVIYNLVEALVCYAKVDSAEVKKLHPQLRELQVYMSKKGADTNALQTLNDLCSETVE